MSNTVCSTAYIQYFIFINIYINLYPHFRNFPPPPGGEYGIYIYSPPGGGNIKNGGIMTSYSMQYNRYIYFIFINMYIYIYTPIFYISPPPPRGGILNIYIYIFPPPLGEREIRKMWVYDDIQNTVQYIYFTSFR